MEDWITATYWVCMLVGVIYTTLALLLGGIADFSGHTGSFGAGHGGFSHDYGVGGHGGHGATNASSQQGGPVIFGPFSPLVIAFFLTCFGACGIVMRQVFHLFPALGVLIAVALAIVLAWILIVLGNRLFGSMQVSSEVHLQSLIGTEAEVTVAIPATSIGEIAYVAMGGRTVAPARSEDQTPIARFTTVRISRVVGNFFFVRPAVEEQLRTLDTIQPGSSKTA